MPTTKTKKREKCGAKGCKRLRQTRGLCNICCASARSLVFNGKTTWNELEKSGLCKPIIKKLSPFQMEYNKKFKPVFPYEQSKDLLLQPNKKKK